MEKFWWSLAKITKLDQFFYLILYNINIFRHKNTNENKAYTTYRSEGQIFMTSQLLRIVWRLEWLGTMVWPQPRQILVTSNKNTLLKDKCEKAKGHENWLWIVIASLQSVILFLTSSKFQVHLKAWSVQWYDVIAANICLGGFFYILNFDWKCSFHFLWFLCQC